MGKKLEILVLSWLIVAIIFLLISLFFNNIFNIRIIDLSAILLIDTVILIKIMKGIE